MPYIRLVAKFVLAMVLTGCQKQTAMRPFSGAFIDQLRSNVPADAHDCIEAEVRQLWESEQLV